MAEALYLIGIQANCATFGNMISDTAILLQEKLAGLQGSLRQLKEDKIQLQAEIDLLKKEKDILMKALDHFTALEDQAENLQNKNILLEAQLDSLLKAIEKMEQDSSN
jgi:seryl-tRNA synthetase